MVQPLWYVRRAGDTRGPYPGPQLAEALRNGDLLPSDEISLDGVQWQALADGLPGLNEASGARRARVDPAWQGERDKARQRWRQDVVDDRPERPDPVLDAVRKRSLLADQAETRAMLDARTNHRPSWLIALAALAVIALIGLVVWYGQEGGAIQAGIGKAGDCGADATPGASWAGCDKRGLARPGGNLQSMTLAGARLDTARLQGANLRYVNLARASLRSADLARADLMGANLDGADLSGADLSGADLRYATLKRAILDGVRLDGVVLGKTTWVAGTPCDRIEDCR